MGGFQHLVVRPTSGLVVGAALAVCLTGYFSPAKAQAPPIQVNPTIAPTTQTTSTIAGTSIFFSQQPLAGDTSALAQATGVAPGPMAPPLNPPGVGALPSGSGALSLGQGSLLPLWDFTPSTITTFILAQPTLFRHRDSIFVQPCALSSTPGSTGHHFTPASTARFTLRLIL